LSDSSLDEEGDMAELQDFSSFDREVEVTFVPFERNMKENEKRAFTIGFGIAGAIGAAAALVVLFLYTPCSNFCTRPPGSCKTDQEISAFKANCEDACRSLEHSSGLKLVHEEKDETGKSNTVTQDVSGTAYVQALAGCAFGGGAGLTCEEVVKNATARGLWCAEKN
jgi:hypothetical protein